MAKCQPLNMSSHVSSGAGILFLSEMSSSSILYIDPDKVIL